MNFGQQQRGAYLPERIRRRFVIGLVLSLLIHGVILSLQLGVPGLGLPGLQLPWNKQRAEAPEISITLTDVKKNQQDQPASNPDVAPERPYDSVARDKPLDNADAPSLAPTEAKFVWTPIPPVPKSAAPLDVSKPAHSSAKTRKTHNTPLNTPAMTEQENKANFIAQQESHTASFNVPVAAPEVSHPEIAPVSQAQSSEDNADKMQEQKAAREQEQADAERQAQQIEQAKKVQLEEATRQEEARIKRQQEDAESRKQAEVEARKQAQLRQQEDDEKRAQQIEIERQKELEKRLALEQEMQAEQQRQEQAAAAAAASKKQEELAAARQQQLAAEAEAAARAAAERNAELAAQAARQASDQAAAQKAAQDSAQKAAAAAALVASTPHDFANTLRDQARQSNLQRTPSVESNTNPRRRSFIGRADRDISLSMYIASFKQKIERNGNLNYSQLSKEKARGDPLVTIAIRSDGTVEEIIINRSSGRADLDEAVKRIVRLNARYAAFPPDIAARYDVIEIRRIWNFEETLRLQEEMQ